MDSQHTLTDEFLNRLSDSDDDDCTTNQQRDAVLNEEWILTDSDSNDASDEELAVVQQQNQIDKISAGLRAENTLDATDNMALFNLYDELNVPTSTVTGDIIQNILSLAKSCKLQNQDEWVKISDQLWSHLCEGLSHYPDQLLCSTCFFTVIMLTNCPEIYFKKAQSVIDEEISKRKEIPSIDLDPALPVSLMYGFLNMNFADKVSEHLAEIMKTLLRSTFCLLTQMAYDYSKYTYVVFKTMKAFQKVLNTDFHCTIFNDSNQKTLLNVINQNWENPITGIRALNSEIMHVLMSAMTREMRINSLKEIDEFYWNKAKYLSLTCFIKFCYVDLSNSLDWIEGIILSLFNPGLVSAGANMYIEILKKITQPREWYDLFAEDITKILKGNSRKAVENFCNHWYTKTLEAFPVINEGLLDYLSEENLEDDILYSILFLVKQSNKLGLVNKDWTDKNKDRNKYILIGLNHWDCTVRMLAFEIVCTSPKRYVPTEYESFLIIQYLQGNVISDSTTLRTSMLNSLNIFLTQLNNYFINQGTKNEGAVKDIVSFCNHLQEFICKSLHLVGNYQRRISTIKILRIVLIRFTKINTYRKPTSKPEDALLKYLISRNSWVLFKSSVVQLLLAFLKDPSDDIRDTTSDILLTFFSRELANKNVLNQLIENATENIRSKFFYKVDCGKTMFKLVANIFKKKPQLNGTFKNLEEVFMFGLKHVFEVKHYRESVVDSIFEGKQQHSYMSILQYVLEVCNKRDYKLKIERDEIMKLLDVLEVISKQFANDDTNMSTDFSEMNDMVEELINLSKYKSNDSEEKTEDCNTTGFHQLVLNCLWLNVKGTCDLLSHLIPYYKDDVEICERSLHIITQVLETSRHKGAIEAAGAALGYAIKYLTGLQEKGQITQSSKLPEKLLQNKLNEIILETGNNMESVTRRGAGLTIMLYRIVSSDAQKGKPFYHIFMKRLIEVCRTSTNQKDNAAESTERDEHNSLYIHFLTKVVIDGSLAYNTLLYATELAVIALDNLTSTNWQMRNAALQLYGALVPKMIGQKKASGKEDESVTTVACDEFRTHFPVLWAHIKKLLNEQSKVWIEDTHFIPILNLLASMAKRYNFSFDPENDDGVGKQLLKSLMKLLGSTIFVVRNMAAKSIYNMYTFEEVYDELLNQVFYSENLLNGHLVLLQCYCHSGPVYLTLDHLKSKYQNVLNQGNHSYICKQLYDEIFQSKVNLDMIKEALNSVNDKHVLGVYSWLDSAIHRFLLSASWEEISEGLKLILDMNDCDRHLQLLSNIVTSRSRNKISEQILQGVADILLSKKEKYNTFGIWKALYTISLQIDISNTDFISQFSDLSLVSYRTRYLLPFLCRNATKITDIDVLNDITIYISTFIQNQTEDDMRQVAAIANNELAAHFNAFPDIIRVSILTNAILFLHDEGETVRNIGVDFLKKLKQSHLSMNPYICLAKIFNKTFLNGIFKDPEVSLDLLTHKIMKIIVKNVKNVDDFNPFLVDTKNIYLELSVLEEFIENLQ